MQDSTMTVKCIRDNGMFDIWTARSVAYWPKRGIEGRNKPTDIVEFTMPNDVVGSFDRGTVYVMNASGKTIEVINLDLLNAA